MDQSVIYTERKKEAIEEAIAKLDEGSSDKQEIGPKDSGEKMWVTTRNSSLSKEILADDSNYKQYPSFFKNGEEYIIFSIPLH